MYRLLKPDGMPSSPSPPAQRDGQWLAVLAAVGFVMYAVFVVCFGLALAFANTDDVSRMCGYVWILMAFELASVVAPVSVPVLALLLHLCFGERWVSKASVRKELFSIAVFLLLVGMVLTCIAMQEVDIKHGCRAALSRNGFGTNTPVLYIMGYFGVVLDFLLIGFCIFFMELDSRKYWG